MGMYASEVIKQAVAWIGKKESDGSHKIIIDIYNTVPGEEMTVACIP